MKKIKLLIFIFILNIMITNNNIKINHNTIQMKNSKKTVEKTNSTQNIENKNRNRNENEELRILEVAKEWIVNKEVEITKESSIINNITGIMKKKLANISLRPNTMHLIIKYIMELIEETPIKGTEQKEVALKVMRELFKDLTEGEDEIVLLKLLDDGSISNLIDLVVDATNGKINVNTAIETSVQVVTTCLPYCLSGKSKTKKVK